MSILGNVVCYIYYNDLNKHKTLEDVVDRNQNISSFPLFVFVDNDVNIDKVFDIYNFSKNCYNEYVDVCVYTSYIKENDLMQITKTKFIKNLGLKDIYIFDYDETLLFEYKTYKDYRDYLNNVNDILYIYNNFKEKVGQPFTIFTRGYTTYPSLSNTCVRPVEMIFFKSMLKITKKIVEDYFVIDTPDPKNVVYSINEYNQNDDLDFFGCVELNAFSRGLPKYQNYYKFCTGRYAPKFNDEKLMSYYKNLDVLYNYIRDSIGEEFNMIFIDDVKEHHIPKNTVVEYYHCLSKNLARNMRDVLYNDISIHNIFQDKKIFNITKAKLHEFNK